MRITPEHPEYKKIQDEAFLMLLDGKLRSHTEIVKFLEPYSPPEPPPPPPPPRRGRGEERSCSWSARRSSPEEAWTQAQERFGRRTCACSRQRPRQKRQRLRRQPLPQSMPPGGKQKRCPVPGEKGCACEAKSSSQEAGGEETCAKESSPKKNAPAEEGQKEVSPFLSGLLRRCSSQEFPHENQCCATAGRPGHPV